MRKAILLISILLVCAGLAGATGPRTVSAKYVAAGGLEAGGYCDGKGPAPAVASGVGGVCFGVSPGEATIQINITDATGLPVAFRLQSINSAGVQEYVSDSGCASGIYSVLPDTVTIYVYPGSVIAGCPVSDRVATTGTVTAAFS